MMENLRLKECPSNTEYKNNWTMKQGKEEMCIFPCHRLLPYTFALDHTTGTKSRDSGFWPYHKLEIIPNLPVKQLQPSTTTVKVKKNIWGCNSTRWNAKY